MEEGQTNPSEGHSKSSAFWPGNKTKNKIISRQYNSTFTMTATIVDNKPKRRRGRQGKQEDMIKKTSNTTFREPNTQTASTGHKTLLLVLNDSTWFDIHHDTPGRNVTVITNPPEKGQSNTSALIIKFKTKADIIMRDELALLTNSKDEKWVESTMKKGTLKDRIAAMSVLVSTNPVHKIFALDQLLDLAVHQSNTRVAQLAAEALEDLFLNTLLVPTRKLIPINQRPLYLYDTSTTTISPRILLLWRFEDLLQEKYNSFLHGYLQATLKNGMELSKLFALRCASRLLRGAPQGEAILLTMLVNKLGDPAKKTAAAAGHELRRVLDQHANMQTIIAREVQQLAHRPALSPKALYNCIIFLNQLQLSSQDKVLPTSLISTYFRLFDVATKEQTEGLKGRLLGALLTGVNRAHPYLEKDDDALNAHMDQLYRVVHTAPPSASTQALLLLFHVTIGNNTPTPTIDTHKQQQQLSNEENTNAKDRFYRALYAKLATISQGKHMTIFFNLIYKAMKHDTNETRVVVLSKRLLCTCLHAPAPLLTASLFLVNEIMKVHPALLTCFTRVMDTDALAMLDATKREPKSALVILDTNEATTRAALWEDQLLQHHVHPSVSKFAKTLGNIEYQGDPLKDFCLAPFLDKFAYKNPKKASVKKMESFAQRHSEGQKQPLPVNDPAFLKQQSVGAEDLFFTQFFKERARRDHLKGIVRSQSTVDEDDRYKQNRRSEDLAFDMAEGADVDHTKKFEEGWNTDPEEEDFVDQLAEKLMQEHAVTTGGGAIDFDDEDPDMEGWDDINDDDVDGNDSVDSDNEERSEGVEFVGEEDDDDDDNNDGPIHISEMFSDDSEDENVTDDQESSDDDNDFGKADDDDDFMDAGDDSDSDEMPDFEGDADSDASIVGSQSKSGKANDSDETDEDSDSHEDEEPEEQPKKRSKSVQKGEIGVSPKPTKKTLKGKTDDAVYADASEYEERISNAYIKQSTGQGNEISKESNKTTILSSREGKRRKRKKTRS